MEPAGDPQAAWIDRSGWDTVLAMGDAAAHDVEATARTFDREDTACFIYTSGTGGRPKGVMLTHRSILANCLGAYWPLKSLGPGDEMFLSPLPLSPSYEQPAGRFVPTSLGAQLYSPRCTDP